MHDHPNISVVEALDFLDKIEEAQQILDRLPEHDADIKKVVLRLVEVSVIIKGKVSHVQES